MSQLKQVTLKRWKWLAQKLNAIIDRVNVLSQITVKPDGAGSFKVSDGNAVLTLTAASVPVHGYIVVGGTLVEGKVLFKSAPTAV